MKNTITYSLSFPALCLQALPAQLVSDEQNQWSQPAFSKKLTKKLGWTV